MSDEQVAGFLVSELQHCLWLFLIIGLLNAALDYVLLKGWLKQFRWEDLDRLDPFLKARILILMVVTWPVEKGNGWLVGMYAATVVAHIGRSYALLQ